ncbi:band 4.1-like protein 3 isoform X5 [Antennarius striatus]|uniref:band 4.1-like protein 3 isoform X5 n=1 Tax=Antennarius striatus TaxID=241820 RepID=UPI0035B2B5E9
MDKEIDITKMMHKEVTGYDRKEMKSHIDGYPSTKLSREADACSEPPPTNKSRFVIELSENQDSFQDKSQSKPPEVSDPEANSDVALGLQQLKERKASKPRKKRRPQSLNLGTTAELIQRKGDSDSTGEENEDSDSDNNAEESSSKRNHYESPPVTLKKGDQGSGRNQSVGGSNADNQEDTTRGKSQQEASSQETEQVKRKVAHVGSADVDLGAVNGPAKTQHGSSLAGVKGEGVTKARGKGLIDNKELAEVKLRQVKTHERKVSSSGGEDIDSFLGERGQTTSLHRLSGNQSEITRIVPLKPERSRSVAYKDERDGAGHEESTWVTRREYRWSVGSPEGPSDLNWADISAFHSAFGDHPDDGYELGRGAKESQSIGSKISALPKMAPPAPPVKTQKARESGLILRNSRNAGRDPSLEAAKKRHSEPVSTPAIYEESFPDLKKDLVDRRPQMSFTSEEELERDTVACMRETHLGIERKCSSMTVSSTSSLEAEVDFTVIMDLHSGLEDFSKGISELGEGEQQPEVGRDDFEETSRFYSARLMGSQDKSPLEEKLPEEGTSHEPPVAKKDVSAVNLAHMMKRSDSRTETQTNGSEIHPNATNVSPQNFGAVSPQEAPAALKLNGSPVKASVQERDPVVCPLTITSENVTSATTTQVTKTVKGGYSETRIEKRIIITGDDDVDQHQALAMAIQEAKQQHPDMLVTKAVVIRESESPTEELQPKAES